MPNCEWWGWCWKASYSHTCFLLIVPCAQPSQHASLQLDAPVSDFGSKRPIATGYTDDSQTDGKTVVGMIGKMPEITCKFLSKATYSITSFSGIILSKSHNKRFLWQPDTRRVDDMKAFCLLQTLWSFRRGETSEPKSDHQSVLRGLLPLPKARHSITSQCLRNHCYPFKSSRKNHQQLARRWQRERGRPVTRRLRPWVEKVQVKMWKGVYCQPNKVSQMDSSLLAINCSAKVSNGVGKSRKCLFPLVAVCIKVNSLLWGLGSGLSCRRSPSGQPSGLGWVGNRMKFELWVALPSKQYMHAHRALQRR